MKNLLEKIKDQNMEKKKQNSLKVKNFTLNFNKKKFSFFSKYINILIKQGKKAKIEKDFFNILRDIRKEKKKIILTSYLTKAINQARPVLILISKKRGGKIYRIPVGIPIKREIFQAVQWTVKETCGRKKGAYMQLLLKELLNLSIKVGNAMRARKNLHKIAEKNRMYITKYYLK